MEKYPPTDIIQFTGHRDITSLNNYSELTDDQQYELSVQLSTSTHGGYRSGHPQVDPQVRPGKQVTMSRVSASPRNLTDVNPTSTSSTSTICKQSCCSAHNSENTLTVDGPSQTLPNMNVFPSRRSTGTSHLNPRHREHVQNNHHSEVFASTDMVETSNIVPSLFHGATVTIGNMSIYNYYGYNHQGNPKIVQKRGQVPTIASDSESDC